MLNEVDIRTDDTFIRLLNRGTLLVSTGSRSGVYSISASSIRHVSDQQAFGLSVRLNQLAIATRSSVEIHSIDDDGSTTLVDSSNEVSGDNHEVHFGETIQVVDTLRSQIVGLPNTRLSMLKPRHVWTPPWIQLLTEDDHCHLNGMTHRGNQLAFVSAASMTDECYGWKRSMDTGVIWDVQASQVVATGLCMPHSPRIESSRHEETLWFLNSGHGQVCRLKRGSPIEIVAIFAGFTRGLCLRGEVAFVGVSNCRKTFREYPVGNAGTGFCGIVAINLTTGATLGTMEFTSGAEEIFDLTFAN